MTFPTASRILAAAALAALGTTATAESYTASNWLPATYPQSVHGYTEMFERVREKTNGEIDFQIHHGGALLPPRTTLTGIRDGVADVGLLFAGYTPAELPVNVFINNLGFLASDPLAATLAAAELNYINQTVIDEWAKFDVVYGGGHQTPLYQALCNTPVLTLEDARGKRLRTAGGSATALAASLEATAVSVPIVDAYSGMQRGSLDCVLADPTNMINASLNEVVTDVTILDLGLAGGPTWGYNKDFWNGLTDDQRALLIDEMALGMVRTQAQFASDTDKAWDDAADRGITIHQPNADLGDHVAAFKAAYIGELIAGIDRASIAEPQALADQYAALQPRWIALLDGVDRTDEAAVLAIVKQNLTNNIDPKTYGK